jgi:uncharacterized membrane protein
MPYEIITDFLRDYFFSGYTIFNTLIYGILVCIATYFIIKALKHFNIDPKDLFIPLIPFIFIGASTRALVDNGIYPRSWFLITPGISFLIASIAVLTILIAIFIEKKISIDFRLTTTIVGTIIAIKNITSIGQLNIIPITEIIAIWIVITILLVIIGKYWKLLKEKINLAAISAHIFDASSTFIAVDFYGYGEQHVLPNSIFNITNTAMTMFPLKIIVILGCLYIIDSQIEDKTISNTLKLAIFGLGLLIALRNTLTLGIAMT